MILPLGQSSLRPVPVAWLWQPYLAAGKVTLLDGDPQCGKSLITVDLAARLSRAAAMPDGCAPAGPLRTMILNAEDDVADTILPRLTAADADLNQVFVPEASLLPDPRFPRDLARLESMIRQAGIHLLVVDPLMAFVPADLATGAPAIVPHVIRPLAALALRTQIAIVIVRHLSKRGAPKAIHCGLGAVGITGLARTGLLAARDPSRPGHCVLAIAKTNLAAPPASLTYRVHLRDGVPAIEWLGPADVTPDALCAAPARPEPIGVVRAIAWLLDALRDGPRPAIELVVAARAAGIAERTLERAKYHLEIKSHLQHETGNKRVWMWQPPRKQQDLPVLPPIPELEPLELPWNEDPADHLSLQAQRLLDRSKLEWAKNHFKACR